MHKLAAFAAVGPDALSAPLLPALVRLVCSFTSYAHATQSNISSNIVNNAHEG